MYLKAFRAILKKEWAGKGQGEWCGTQITCTNKHAVTKPCRSINRAIHRWNNRINNIKQNSQLLEALKNWSNNKQEINTFNTCRAYFSLNSTFLENVK